MHLPVKMVRQSPIVIQPTEIGATDVADLELLVARGTRRVGERLQFALFLLLGLLGGAHFEEFCQRARYAAFFAKDGNFEEAAVDGAGEVGDLFELWGGVRVGLWARGRRRMTRRGCRASRLLGGAHSLGRWSA